MLENGPEVASVWVGTGGSVDAAHPFPEEDEAVEQMLGSPEPHQDGVNGRLTEVFRLGREARRSPRWVLRTQRTQS